MTTIDSVDSLARTCYDWPGSRKFLRHSSDKLNAESYVRRGVFKYTDCGACFNTHGKYVTVSGYCEGSDGELPTYELRFPFTEDDWWKALTKCEADASEEWNSTHGCELCWPQGHCTENEELEFGNWPINPECANCEGAGVIL